MLGSSDTAGPRDRTCPACRRRVRALRSRRGATRGCDGDSALIPVGGEGAALSARGELLAVTTRDEGASRGARVEPAQESRQASISCTWSSARNGTMTELLRRDGAGRNAAAGDRCGRRPAPEPASLLQGSCAQARRDRRRPCRRSKRPRAAASRHWSAIDVAGLHVRIGGRLGLCGMAAFARADYVTAIGAFRDAQTAGADDPPSRSSSAGRRGGRRSRRRHGVAKRGAR